MTDTGSIFSGDLSITQGLEQLRMRLLDLTGRNRLLNFRHTAGRSLQFVSCNPEAVYQRLVVATGGQKVTISAVPEPKADQWIEKNGRLSPPDARQHAESLGINTAYDIPSELALPALEEKGQQARALYYPDDLGKHCRKLEREAKSAIEETGANMLYLVFGFLEFPDTKDSDKPFHAPLVSVPVRFEGSSDGRYVTYKIAYTGEEVDENLSLREKIKRDYQINLPPFPEDLESVEDYFSAIAKVIKPLPKWRLRRMVSLALLSFANMLLVRDLEPQRWTLGGKKSLLLEHDLVKRVFSGAPEGSPIEYASEYEVDNHQHADLNIIYDADSSQHSALIDVLNGRSMVIEGPPGTGKSQTITNIIASCLQAGKSVLFVSEKLAALQVVKSNLSRVGLDPFLLELHSNKTSKKAVLDDISSRIAFRPRTPPGIEDTEAALKAKKRELKEHSALLNSVVGNKMGCTVHQVLWRAERHRIELGEVANASLDITFEPAPHTTAGEYNVLADQMGYLASHHEEIGSFSNTHPFWGFYPTRLQPGDDLSVGRLFDDVVPTLLHLEQQLRDLEAIVGIEGHSLLSMKASTESLNKLKSLASKLDANAAHELLPRIFFASSPRTQRAIELVSYAEALFDGIAHLKARIAGRIVDSRVGPETAKNIGEHENTIASVGLLELNTAKLRTHVAELRQAAEHAIAGLAMIRQLSSDIGLPTDDSRTGIQRFETILNESEHAPDRSLRFRHPGLNDPDARETIKKALTDKTRLFAKEQSLSSMLYLDNPVPDDALRESITALRQGSAWYRIFQKRWRQAIRFHRDLRRDKSKLSPETRLAELEDLNLFQKTKRDWHANESVKAACGPHYRGEDSPFADLLQISSWMLQAHDRLAAAGIPTALFDPSTIDAQHLAKLRTVRSEAKQSLEAISSIFSLPKRIFKLQPQQLSELAATPNMSAYIQRVVDTAASIESAATFFAQYTSADIPVVESATALRDTIELHSKKELSMAPDLVDRKSVV